MLTIYTTLLIYSERDSAPDKQPFSLQFHVPFFAFQVQTLLPIIITAQFVETNGLVKHNIYQELKQTIMDLDLQITRKHPVLSLPLSSYLYSESQGMPNLDHVIYRRSLDDCMTCYCCCTK